MHNLTLVIGNKNYSSWSLRPWLLLKHVGASFEEIRIPLYGTETHAEILRHSPSGRVPVLINGDLRVWESLAICEYVADLFPQANVWPDDPTARAVARSVSSEMHAGFTPLRFELSMNCRGPRTGVTPSEMAQADIDRIVELWTECRARFGAAGPWLFGRFSAADAMFAPVVIRFWAYGVPLPEVAAQYVSAVLEAPALREWMEAGRAETEDLDRFDRGTLQA